MDLSTTYLGMSLPHPLLCGASPLADELDTVRRLEDAGVAAIVLRSLFEEQVTLEELGTWEAIEAPAEAFAEARTYLPEPATFTHGPDQYLEQIRRTKEAVRVPVIASLNGTTPTGWLDWARLIQEAGADALELNTYFLATDPREPGTAVEERTLDILRLVRREVAIPLAVKLSPFFSSLPHLAQALDQAGADGLVVFNRFYQPDIDPELLEHRPTLHLSDSSELLLRLRWTAVLSGHVGASLAVSGGVHTPIDAIKAVMAGAHAVQMVSALLRHGPQHLAAIREGLVRWMEDHEYESLRQMQGSMSLRRCPDPGALERANYARVLQSWRPAAVPGR